MWKNVCITYLQVQNTPVVDDALRTKEEYIFWQIYLLDGEFHLQLQAQFLHMNRTISGTQSNILDETRL